MKKVLSMVLALALVLTTLVVPMTVSAAGETITISYTLTQEDAEDTNIYPGETVTVAVNATADTDVTVSGYWLAIPYNANGMTITEAEGYIVHSSEIEAYSDTALELEANTAAELFTFEFEVPQSALGDYAFGAISADTYDSEFAVGYETVYPSATAKDFAVSACVPTVTLSDNVEVSTSGTTITANSEEAVAVTINVESNWGEISDVTVDGTEYTLGETAFSTFGNYTLSFKTAADGKPHTYTIKYRSSATVNLAVEVADSAVKPGETVELSVKVENLGTNTVEVLTFDIEYDDEIFTSISESHDYVEIDENGAVTYEVPENGTAHSGTDAIFTIELSAGQDAKTVGVQDIALANGKIALGGATIEELDDANFGESGNSDEVSVVIYDEAAVSVAVANSDWEQSNTVTVTAPAGGWNLATDSAITVYYKGYNELPSETPEASALAETKIENGSFTVTNEQSYYVVAKFGTDATNYYAIIDTLEASELWIDITAPNVTMTTTFEDWTHEGNLEFTVSDAQSGAVTLYYMLNGTGDSWSDVEVENGAATVELTGAQVITSIKVYAVDEAGNGSASDATTIEGIKYDTVVPEIELANGVYTDGKVPITVKVTATDGDVPETVKIQHYTTDEGSATVVVEEYDLTSGEATYNAESNGYYIFTVVDRAGNTVSATSEEVDVDKKSVIRKPSFDVISGEGASTGTLKTNEELATSGVTTNGTFTYMNVTAASDANGTNDEGDEYITEYTLNGADWTLGEITTAGDYTLVVETYMKDAPTDSQTVTYQFSIADSRSTFKTVNDDIRYTITDYIIMRDVATSGFNAMAQYFKGGYFSGNVSGSLQENYFEADRTTLLNEMKTTNTWRNYNLAIYNGLSAIE